MAKNTSETMQTNSALPGATPLAPNPITDATCAPVNPFTASIPAAPNPFATAASTTDSLFDAKNEGISATQKCTAWSKEAYQKAKPHVVAAAGKCAEWCKRAYQRAKPHVIAGAENIRHWFLGLQPRTQIIVAATTGVLVVGMLGLAVARMSGSNGQSPNVPQVGATVVVADDTQTKPAGRENEGTVVSAQAAPTPQQVARNRAEIPNAAPPVIGLEGHTGSVNSAAFSPDGKKIVTGSSDDTARIWDAETGKELRKLEGHTSSVNSATFSPDGKKIVTGGDRTARIWDTETGKELQKLEGHTSGVSTVAFSPDGKKIVTGSGDRTARIWDAETGKLEGHISGVSTVAFSPDGKKIVTGSGDRTARIWDAETGKELQKLEGHTDSVRTVAFSPDGKKIVTGSSDRTARIWDAETGIELQKLEGHTERVSSVAFSPDGKKIVTGSWDRTARIWDAETGKELRKLEGHTSSVNSATFSPDGKKIVTGSSDRTPRIWDVETGIELQKLEGHTEWVSSVAFSPDGKKIVKGRGSWDKTARIWDALHVAEQGAILLQQREKEEAERLAARMTALAGATDINVIVRMSGLPNLNEFALFGTVKLRDDYLKADAFDEASVWKKIETAQAILAQRVFKGEYTYSTSNVVVDGNKSSFIMTIPTGFMCLEVEESYFPVPVDNISMAHVLYQRPLLGYAFLTKDNRLQPVGQADIAKVFESAPAATLFVCHDDTTAQIALTIEGNTVNIRELVRNSSNYRVRVWFTNLRYGGRQEEPMVFWHVTSNGETFLPVSRELPNPFITDEVVIAEYLTADILKIEIIKVK